MGADVLVVGDDVLDGALVADAAGGLVGETSRLSPGRDWGLCGWRRKGRVPEDGVKRAIAHIRERESRSRDTERGSGAPANGSIGGGDCVRRGGGRGDSREAGGCSVGGVEGEGFVFAATVHRTRG